MAQIFDVPQVPVQRSLTGSVLDSAAPGQYYDQADIARRQAASAASSAAYANPNYSNTPQGNSQRNYLAGGVPYDVEGLLRSVAMKYGIDAAKALVEKMPTMSRSELMAIYKLVQGAAREADAMDDRERMAYERAGMQYRQGQYVPK